MDDPRNHFEIPDQATGRLYNPYIWPAFSSDSTLHTLSLVFMGAALSESLQCLNVIIKRSAKWRTPMFQLTGIAACATALACTFALLLISSPVPDDLFYNGTEYGVQVASTIMIALVTISYTAAAAYRTHSILKQARKQMAFIFLVALLEILAKLWMTVTFNTWFAMQCLFPPRFDLVLGYFPALNAASFADSIMVVIFMFAINATFLMAIWKGLNMDWKSGLMFMLREGITVRLVFGCLIEVAYLIAFNMVPASKINLALTDLALSYQLHTFLLITYEAPSKLIQDSRESGIFKKPGGGSLSSSGSKAVRSETVAPLNRVKETGSYKV